MARDELDELLKGMKELHDTNAALIEKEQRKPGATTDSMPSTAHPAPGPDAERTAALNSVLRRREYQKIA